MADQSAADLLRANLEAFSAGDAEAFSSMLAENAVYSEFATQRTVEGREAVTEVSFAWRDAFPDARAVINSVLETADGAVAEIVWQGTQTGDMETPTGTIPASGNSVSIPASMSATISGGAIQETRHYFDLFSLLKQVGAIPEESAE